MESTQCLHYKEEPLSAVEGNSGCFFYKRFEINIEYDVKTVVHMITTLFWKGYGF
jgi:hypothetical protein